MVVSTDMGVILTPGFSLLGETTARDPSGHSLSLSLCCVCGAKEEANKTSSVLARKQSIKCKFSLFLLRRQISMIIHEVID